SKTVNAVRASRRVDSEVAVANRALGNLCHITLESNGIHVVVSLKTREFGVLGPVTTRAEYLSMAGAVAIEIFTGLRDIGVSGKGHVLCLPPLSLRSKRRSVAKAAVVAHLATGFIKPAGAGGIPHFAQVAVTGGA